MRSFGVVLGLILLAGCGSSPSVSGYHSYGDSITFGATLNDPNNQAYPAVFSKANGLTLRNMAIGGDQACDVSKRQIFPAGDSPSVSAPLFYSLLIGTNDTSHGSMSAQTTFNLCHQAAVAWLAVPVEYKVLGSSATVTSVGASHLETGWNALTTDARGSSLSFPIKTTAAGPIYVWYRIQDVQVGSFSYVLDGVVLGSVSVAPASAIATQNGTSSSLALLRIAGIPAGAHIVTFVQTSDPDPLHPTALAGAGIVAVGAPPPAGTTGLSRVLGGLLTPQVYVPGQTAACVPDTSPCVAYDADISANLALLAGDGLRVGQFNAGKYIVGNGDMADALHPNAIGQAEIAHALQDIY